MRSFSHTDFGDLDLSAVSVVLPARECAETVGPIVESLQHCGQVLVVDAASADGTAAIAAAAGAEVHQEASLLPEFGPVLGKGDAMWRALSVLDSDVIVFLDADSEGFGPHFATGLIGPLVCGDTGVEFVKAFYRRPLKVGEVSLPEGGGRVTELMARPLLNLFYPELAGFRQPLAGELAATRDLLLRLPFATGYAVEIAMLIDAWREVGLDALAQVDIEMRQNRHQPLAELTPMAYAVLRAVCTRLEREGRLNELEESELLLPRETLEERGVPLTERPPLASIRTA